MSPESTAGLRIAILIDLSVTPRYVLPPLLPLNFATHGFAYVDHGICLTPGLHSKPATVLPVPSTTLPTCFFAPSTAGPATGPPDPVRSLTLGPASRFAPSSVIVVSSNSSVSPDVIADAPFVASLLVVGTSAMMSPKIAAS